MPVVNFDKVVSAITGSILFGLLVGIVGGYCIGKNDGYRECKSDMLKEKEVKDVEKESGSDE